MVPQPFSFYLSPREAILSDLNPRLIETFVAIRDDVDNFMSLFLSFAQKHSKDFYYGVRHKVYTESTMRAAQFLYLNRVCFNGIYRENLKGIFNVPIGSKKSATLDSDDFSLISKKLSGVEILVSDFEVVVDRASEGDFLFVDPPYTTKHNNNGFVKYNQNIFSWADQERLALGIVRAASRGAKIVVTNADHFEVRELYKENFEIRSLQRATIIASNSASRGMTTEMVATNV